MWDIIVVDWNLNNVYKGKKMKSIVSGCCDTNRDIFKTNAILVKKYMYIYDVKSSKILRKA